MPIQAPGQPILAQQIRAALNQARDAGQQSSANSDQIINELANNLTNAIHQYVTTIIVTINPGQAITGASPAGPITGTTISPGSS